MQITIDQLSQYYTINEIRKLLALYIVYLPEKMESIEYDSIHKAVDKFLPNGNVIIILSPIKEPKIELLSINQLTEIDTDTITSLLNTIKEYGIKSNNNDHKNEECYKTLKECKHKCSGLCKESY